MLLAGGAGAAARYGLSGLIAHRVPEGSPVGTVAVNVVGSAGLGILVALGVDGTVSAAMLQWAGTGFLGAFTTFSTFTYETIELAIEGRLRAAATNVVLSVALSIGAAAVGYYATL